MRKKKRRTPSRPHQLSRRTGADHDKHVSRITIVSSGTPDAIEQIIAQLEQIIEVRHVRDLTVHGKHVERELALVKVVCLNDKRIEALRIADIFRARVVDSTLESFVFEVTGDAGKIEAFLDLMRPLGMIDVSRTGIAGIARGKESLSA